MGALSNVFCSQMFLIYFVCCIFDSNPLHGFAFNCTILHVSGVLLASKVDAQMYFKYCYYQNLLALAKTNANAFNAIKSVQNATLIFFSTQNYINVITIWCPFQDTQSAI